VFEAVEEAFDHVAFSVEFGIDGPDDTNVAQRYRLLQGATRKRRFVALGSVDQAAAVNRQSR